MSRVYRDSSITLVPLVLYTAASIKGSSDDANAFLVMFAFCLGVFLERYSSPSGARTT